MTSNQKALKYANTKNTHKDYSQQNFFYSQESEQRNRNKGLSQQLSIAIFILGIFLSAGILVLALSNLTIIQNGILTARAKNNATFDKIIPAQRGIIYDSTGKSLTENTKEYSLTINQKIVTLTSIENMYPSLNGVIDTYFRNNGDDKTSDRIVLTNIPKDIALQVLSSPQNGIELGEVIGRFYPYRDIFSHMLGYTGILSSADKEARPYLTNISIVGKSGLEYQYDDILRGVNGAVITSQDALGKTLTETTSKKESIHGSDLILSINSIDQQRLYEKVKKYVDKYSTKGGSAVIVNVNSGAIKALVSYPSYDNNLFSQGISTIEYKKLIDNPQTPLLYRPIGAQEPPGSTFKTVVGSAALQTNAITQKTIFNATGTITLAGGTKFQDYRKKVHGNLDVKSALTVSSNIFFCKTMLAMGIEPFLPIAKEFHIGEETGIDIPGEAKGRLPSPENKIWLAKNGAYWLDPIWYPEGDACNSAIGQGITLATPLQMAMATSVIANGGTYYQPRIVAQLKDTTENIQEISPKILNQGFISPENLTAIREGMRMGVTGARGIISSLRNAPISVAAKTGTAEFGVKDRNGYLTSHAWIIGFYPYEKPEYAFAILLEGGDDSSRATALIKEFLQETYK